MIAGNQVDKQGMATRTTNCSQVEGLVNAAGFLQYSCGILMAAQRAPGNIENIGGIGVKSAVMF
jgi:hypothetical protein